VIGEYARSSERCIVTRDFSFADMRRYPPRAHFGIVVLTVPPGGGSLYIAGLVRELVARLPELDPLTGKLLIIEPNRIRVRD